MFFTTLLRATPYEDEATVLAVVWELRNSLWAIEHLALYLRKTGQSLHDFDRRLIDSYGIPAAIDLSDLGILGTDDDAGMSRVGAVVTKLFPSLIDDECAVKGSLRSIRAVTDKDDTAKAG
ncbi:hypothetical protein FGG08_005682 [Glutinoglossum americanum]|uniref:Uncharacterized protein n=1 Tax=Glutinoglossum americanum TaxID=1670608 RepID=A0A9P8L162_9PEZI|nr:hypothetical protein FGG08_005682 [Glutinoglossum americanum]